MKLKAKVTSIIVVSWLCLFVLAITVVQSVMQHRFLKQVEAFASENLQRILHAFDERKNSLSRLTIDWANNDNTYYFSTTGDEKYISYRITPQRFEDNKLNFLIILSKGKILYQKAYNLTADQFTPFPDLLLKQINTPEFFDNVIHKKIEEGFIRLSDQLLLISADPVFDSAKKNKADAVLVTATSVDEVFINEIVGATGLKFQFLPINNFLIPINKTSSVFIKNNMVYGYTYLFDVFDTPIQIIEMSYPATMYLEGKKFIAFFIVVLLFFGTAVSILFWLLLERFILRRIDSLKNQVTAVAGDKSYSHPIVLAGKDELNTMADEINAMLSVLSAVYQKELSEGKKQLEYTLYHDAETQLPNKVYFNRILVNQMIMAKERGVRFAVGVAHLKNFRMINDNFGHAAGEAALKQISARLQAVLHHPEYLARYSSDEFVFCTFQVESEAAIHESAKEILRALEEPVYLEKSNVYFKVGMYFVVYPDDARDLTDVQQKLGVTTSEAKNTGESEIIIYNKAMQPTVVSKVMVEANLHHAIANHELELFFQPKINLHSFTMTSAETLIRWRHPQYGLISPSEFIPIAEETGLIKAIGMWSLHTACQKCVEWKRRGFKAFSVAVNASATQFMQPGFVEEVQAILEKYQCPPELIEIELTESLLVGNIDFVIQRLVDLGSIGVKIAIDDFGTGYSSLNYLKRLPVHYIKIDKSFIDGTPDDKNNTAICEAIITLAKSLDLKVIAEGVETAKQLDFLINRQCDLIQGYIFSKPLPETDLIELLELFKKDKSIESAFWRNKSIQVD